MPLRSPLWKWHRITQEDAPADKSTGSDCAFKLVSSWLEDCISNHKACWRPDFNQTTLPTRVIDVGLINGTRCPKLIDGNGAYGKYCALSHCWGERQVLTTTLDTLPERYGRLPLESMSKTFRDAVNICWNLGIPYLWIDSLCIIQDSKSDWETESCKMADVYRNAHVVIAALHAKDGSGGCFTARDGFVARPIELPIRGVPPHSSTVRQLYWGLYDHKPVRDHGENPLETRGWTLQEWLLSRRLISYSRHDVGWECLSTKFSEREHEIVAREGFKPPFLELRCAIQGTNISGRNLRVTRRAKLREEWEKVVENYSARSLTDPNDKLIAIHGVAESLAKATKDSYVAGLFKDWITVDMLWFCIPATSSPTNQTKQVAPSWSWASSSSPVRFLRDRQYPSPIRLFIPISRIVAINTDGSPVRHSGTVTLEGCYKIALGEYIRGGAQIFQTPEHKGFNFLEDVFGEVECRIRGQHKEDYNACWFPDAQHYTKMPPSIVFGE
ncbi:het-domain-containing protein [Fusarium mundagurra]|uniref:Het-domain-containing protein n=1 Tax=Fusarium mundagurra TaxID=1567541 RepID=A0A8H5Y710_9HYPO|nr:het-domain-containing protein [Fusarium mundagurra]